MTCGCMFTVSLGLRQGPWLRADSLNRQKTSQQHLRYECVVHKPPRETFSASGLSECVCVCMHVQATDLRKETIANKQDNMALRLDLHWQRSGTAPDWTSKKTT